MPEHFINLNRQEALKAICLDLRRYETQTMLIAELLRIVYGDPSIVDRDSQRNGVWIKIPGRKKMQYFEGAALVSYVCDFLQTTPIHVQILVELCRRVFQATVKIIDSEGKNSELLQIDTGMTGFRCRCCGNCCRDLDYHREITGVDIHRWQSEQRKDILRWVGQVKNAQSLPVYHIWIVPGTNQFSKTCPFLVRGATEAQWLCSIEETKPEICRQYPFSRKHAVMTGCSGFAK